MLVMPGGSCRPGHHQDLGATAANLLSSGRRAMIRTYPSLSSQGRPSCRRWLFAMITALLCDTAVAEGLRVGLIAKSVDDINFIEAGRSCAEEARKFGDECVLLGSREGGGARGQVLAIEAALKTRRFDAFAISVTKSDFIAPAVQRIPVPVITFDLNPCSFVIDQTQPVDSLREYMLSPLHPTDHAAL